MALGRRKPEPRQFWIASGELPRSPGPPFCAALNRLLAEAEFDRFVEQLCALYYADNAGRPGIAPGVYLRMLLVGDFEGLGSQRGIACRCSDSRIARLKDGRTRLAYKAEHVVDLESDLILAATVQTATRSDSETLSGSLMAAQASLVMSGSEVAIEDAVADKGHHKAETPAQCEAWAVRTYIPSRREPHHHRWTDRPPAWQAAYRANARRVQDTRGKRLSRLRSELPERSFAHVCGTGGARWTWIRGLTEVGKRHLIAATAHNLSVIMRALYGIGAARSLQGTTGALHRPQTALVRAAHRALVLVSIVIGSLVYRPKINRSWLPKPLAA